MVGGFVIGYLLALGLEPLVIAHDELGFDLFDSFDYNRDHDEQGSSAQGQGLALGHNLHQKRQDSYKSQKNCSRQSNAIQNPVQKRGSLLSGTQSRDKPALFLNIF